MRKRWMGWLAALLTCLLLFSGWAGAAFLPDRADADAVSVVMTAKKKKNKPTTTATPKPTAASKATAAPETAVAEEASDPAGEEPVTAPQAIADYLFAHGELPPNFITKQEARVLGWDSSRNFVSDVAPGKSIGGDRFGNYEGLLPVGRGITYIEADCNYVSGRRGAERIIYSSDGRVWYTGDHYQSFQELFPSETGAEKKP